MSNVPTSFSKTPERSTEDFPVEQKRRVVTEEDRDTVIESVPALARTEAEALKMGEEPVTIMVARSTEKNAPASVDCWVNGKGIEIMLGDRWVPTGAAPRGIPFTTKRKYVEVLMRARIDSVENKHDPVGSEHVNNWVERNTSQFAHVQLLKDDNPNSLVWFESISRRNM